MLRTAIIALLITAPAAAERPMRQIGKETVIQFAGNGGIRNFEAGPSGSNIVYLQDRRLDWYQVTLSGPCVRDRALDTISFNTDPSGAFDRFSTIVSRRYPNTRCGVANIVNSLPPKGQPGAPKTAE